MGQLDQYQQTRAALDQGADCAGIARTLELPAPLIRSPLPVARKLPALNLRWTHVDAQQASNLAAPVLPTRARPAFGTGHAQASHKLAFELASQLCIDDVIDGFVGGALGCLMGMQFSQVGCNLLG